MASGGAYSAPGGPRQDRGFSQPSTGQSFEEKSNGVTDLSDICLNPFQGQSMSGGNVTTTKQNFGGQTGHGSFSEGTAQVMDTAQHDFGDATEPGSPFVRHEHGSVDQLPRHAKDFPNAHVHGAWIDPEANHGTTKG